MLTFNQALRIAIEKMQDINYCSETNNAFIFSNHESGIEFGPMGPVVVLKDGDVVMTVEDYELAELSTPPFRQGYIG